MPRSEVRRENRGLRDKTGDRVRRDYRYIVGDTGALTLISVEGHPPPHGASAPLKGVGQALFAEFPECPPLVRLRHKNQAVGGCNPRFELRTMLQARGRLG